MSFEPNFSEGLDCPSETIFEVNPQDFPETISYCEDFLMSRDTLHLGQLDCSDPFFCYAQDFVINPQECQGLFQNTNSDEETRASPNFEDLCVSYDQVESKQDSFSRMTLEKMTSDSRTSESLSSTFYVERDPLELHQNLVRFRPDHDEMIVLESPLVFSHVDMDLMPERFQDGLEIFLKDAHEESLEIPSPRSLSEVFSSDVSKKWRKAGKGKKTKNRKSRQSKFKNIYSLVEEHARRLLSDYVKLKPKELQMVEDENRKSEKVKREEERWLKMAFQNFCGVQNKVTDINKKIKPEKFCEMSDFLNDKDKNLLQRRLKYKRFRLLSSLSKLVNDTPNAFLQREELIESLKGKPKSRTQVSIMEFLKKNIHFGLLVSSLAVELLSFPDESQKNAPLRESSLALMFWLVKSPMHVDNRRLLVSEDTRNHIIGVLEDFYNEVKETALERLSIEEMQAFEAWLREMKHGDLREKESEGDFSIDFACISQFDQCGKRRNFSENNYEGTPKRQKRN